MSRLAICLLFVVVACATGAGTDHYVLDEWVVGGPERIPAGTDSITVENIGEWSHTLVVTTEDGLVVAASGLIESSAAITLDAPLAPGSYVFSCRIVAEDEDGGLSDHYERGMSHRVIVEA
ncbi:MAG TPA: hypothetical protein VFV13_10860 [Acidimicrobiia bacterium]|nr:hypothetical protein [Acidimicrobiia bacterium]